MDSHYSIKWVGAMMAMGMLLCAMPVLAHSSGGQIGGFFSGFMHPLSGPDHVVAMMAVGLWGAFLGQPAIWVLPVVFPMVMAVGGVLGIAGMPVPSVEILIALSGIVLGVMVLLAVRPPLWSAAVLVGVFAIFHGYAHGAELPSAATPLPYSVGFVMATGLIHLCGIAIGLIDRWSIGKRIIQGAGGVIACVGGYFLYAAI